MDEPNDKALLGEIAQGDKRAMRIFYERHQKSVCAFIRSRGCDAITSDDVLHDTMLDIWRQAGRYHEGASVRSWLFTIARNKLVDRIRKSSRLTLMDNLPDVEDISPNAEAIIDAAQDAERVQKCVANLNDTQRNVIHLSFYEGLTYDEIAVIEAVPSGTVKSRIFHAKQALMRCLTTCGHLMGATQ